MELYLDIIKTLVLPKSKIHACHGRHLVRLVFWRHYFINLNDVCLLSERSPVVSNILRVLVLNLLD